MILVRSQTQNQFLLMSVAIETALLILAKDELWNTEEWAKPVCN
jgi:hypothetical protein